MINSYVIKKWAAFLIVGMFTTTSFAIGSIFYGFLIGVACMLVALIVFTFMGFLLIKNPFTSMLEGKGVLALDMNSTGIITPFVVGLKNPDLFGKVHGKVIKDVFDRQTVMTLTPPVTAKDAKIEPVSIDAEGIFHFSLDKENYNKSRFAMLQYPVLIYNGHLNSFMTKDFFSEMEKSAFAEHTVLYLNRNMQELTSLIRDFGRYIVESLKPKTGLAGKWIWIIIGVFVVILIVMFAPSIISVLKGTGDSAVAAVGGAGGSGGTIVPAPLPN